MYNIIYMYRHVIRNILCIAYIYDELYYYYYYYYNRERCAPAGHGADVKGAQRARVLLQRTESVGETAESRVQLMQKLKGHINQLGMGRPPTTRRAVRVREQPQRRTKTYGAF
jgi:hypothetical protein